MDPAPFTELLAEQPDQILIICKVIWILGCSKAASKHEEQIVRPVRPEVEPSALDTRAIRRSCEESVIGVHVRVT